MRKKITLVVLLIFIISSTFLEAAQIQVIAAVEKNVTYVGESFIYQITVKESNTPEEPQISGIDGFTVTFLGGFDQSSQTITIINGKQSVTVKKSYVFQYRVSPQRAGTLTIPSVMVKVDGRNYMTEPISISVRKPEEVEDYKLRIRLGSATCFVGEKMIVTVTWYLAKEAKGPIEFTIPLFNDTRFEVISPDVQMDQSKEYVTLSIGNEQINAEYSSGRLGGKSYNTVFFKKILIPKKAGTMNIPAATISFQGVTQYRRVRDFWGREYDKAEYGNVVIPSNTLSFTVKSLPEAGKPANYTGLIGNYSITASAAPLNVRVGDPITLTLTLKGTGYLEDAELPPLHELPELAEDFKIPRDIAPGEVKENEVVFIQTLRAVHDKVTEIPPIEIPYFNAKKNTYDYAVTKAIPISVEPATNELSVLDMEGKDPIELKREIEIWEEGIAHNYEGYDVLRNQASGLGSLLRNPFLLFLIIFPVIAYLVLLYIFRFSPMVRGDRFAILVKKSYGSLISTLEHTIAHGISDKTANPDSDKGRKDEKEEISLQEYPGRLMDELKAYLGAKLKSKAGSLTFQDIEGPLTAHGVSEETINKLKTIFETCEASHYAGGAFLSEDAETLSRKTLKVVEEIERSFT